ncbi:hypothetical protein GCM10007301_15550 [Azorhizobium oxalatiphilum]|uniref:Uncharacterized protein n=1 Tax=Azorhizobium oxalatiphilum TaxID=980631 RepID=A0A917FA32_9HYPH|nr:hypothetical protein [Azorhizobium oxalatiphilum]GGF56753.1 hypothetical protein GCM10007301_15550 [Azorhizobium oxalatiphilum]
MSWLDDLVARFVSDADDIALAQAAAATVAGGGELGALAHLELCRLVGESTTDTRGLLRALDDVSGGTRDLISALVIACFATVRAGYPARQDAQEARTALTARADGVLDAAGAAYGAEVHAWLIRLVGETTVQISAIAATLAPVVRVETGISLPSSLIAFDLYGDPALANDLVGRNRTGTAMLMPVRLEALAP